MIIYSAARVTALTSAGQLDNPFVAFDNQAALASAILAGTATLTDGGRSNAVSGTTYDYWLPNVTGTTAQFSVKLVAPITISCVGMVAHNLFTLGGTVILQHSTDGGSTWTGNNLGSTITPTDNGPIVWRVATTGLDAADWRLSFAGLAVSAPLFVGVMFFGSDLIFPRRFYRDFAPALTPTEVQLQSNVSVGGNLLGSSIVAQGSTMSASFRNITDTFARGSLLPFIPHFNAGKGFLFGWRPTTYPQDAHYCWREGATIRPVNSGPQAFMSLEMQMRAYES